MVKSKDPVTTYNEAVAFLRAAVDNLDQAHAALKDINLDQYVSTRVHGHYASLLDAVAMADKLLEDVLAARCEECGRLLRDNELCLSEQCHVVPAHDDLRFGPGGSSTHA